MHQKRLAAGFQPNPLGELTALSRPPSWIRSRGRDKGRGRETGGGGQGRKGARKSRKDRRGGKDQKGEGGGRGEKGTQRKISPPWSLLQESLANANVKRATAVHV